MEYKDYYKILGVPRNASQADIRKAFRKLAREHHPDVKPGDRASEQRFKDINEANAVLSDASKRKQYDTLGANWEAFSGARGGAAADPFGPGGPFAGFRPAGGNVRYEFRTAGSAGSGASGFSDFFRTFFTGEAANPTGTPGATTTGGRRRRATSGATFEDILADMDLDEATGAVHIDPDRRPASMDVDVEMSLEEAYHGTSRIVEVDGKRLEVTVPRGVDNGSRIRLRGKGPNGRDLYLVTKLRSHPVFSRNGADLTRELPVTLQEALLGAEVPVTTLKGRVLLTLPPGTQNGRTFRLTGQGMPRLDGKGTGDLFVRVRVVLPSVLSPDAAAQAKRLFDLVDQPDPRSPN